MIQIRYSAEETEALLNELRSRMGDLRPVMDAVGQIIREGTQQRFVDQQGPDGTPWAPLKPATIAARRRGGGTGSIQILRDTDRLMNSIDYRAGAETVTVFSNVIYSGVHQYGWPKKNIPARPFFGYNALDQQAVVTLLQGYLKADETLSWWERLVDRVKGWFR
jgi:phage virion morphogenesis protein